jgi:Pvc16 N-terminal domain
MAGAAAIRHVSETLERILRASLDHSVILPTNIRIATPDEFADIDTAPDLAITIFLFRVVQNPELRNSMQRTLPDGRVMRAAVPLQLWYMITPWARDTLDEHLLSGMIVQALHEHAELSRSELVGDSWRTEESVQLVLDSLPPEDHYRIWDTAKMPYRLSLAYQVRVVNIDPPVSEPAARVVTAELGFTDR